MWRCAAQERRPQGACETYVREVTPCFDQKAAPLFAPACRWQSVVYPWPLPALIAFF